MVTRTRALLLVLQLGFVSTAYALPIEIEGPISAITVNDNGTPEDPTDDSATITVMGMLVNIPAGTPISSPTASLSIAQLADATPLPGRLQPGFIGGTAIINGESVDGTTLTAADVFVEPAENVVLGPITRNEADQFAVNGVPVVMLTEESTGGRLPGEPVKNSFGFEVSLFTVPVGTSAGVEAYYAQGSLHAFIVETEAGALVEESPQVSVLRAACVENSPSTSKGDGIEVRGGVTMSHTTNNSQKIEVYRVDNGVPTMLRTVNAARDLESLGFGTYRLSMTTNKTSDPAMGRCPAQVKVVNVDSPNRASTTGEVRVIE